MLSLVLTPEASLLSCGWMGGRKRVSSLKLLAASVQVVTCARVGLVRVAFARGEREVLFLVSVSTLAHKDVWDVFSDSFSLKALSSASLWLFSSQRHCPRGKWDGKIKICRVTLGTFFCCPAFAFAKMALASALPASILRYRAASRIVP